MAEESKHLDLRIANNAGGALTGSGNELHQMQVQNGLDGESGGGGSPINNAANNMAKGSAAVLTDNAKQKNNEDVKAQQKIEETSEDTYDNKDSSDKYISTRSEAIEVESTKDNENNNPDSKSTQ